MTTTSAKPDHRSLPRAKRAPSARDQAILVAYRTRGCTQTDLSAKFHLSQRRISQIIHRTQHWLENGIPELLTAAPGGYGMSLPSTDSLDRQRLERRLARERDQAIFDRALFRHDHQPEALVTTVEYFSSWGGPPAGPTLTRSVSEGPPSENRKLNTENLPSPSRLTRTTRQVAPSGQFLRAALRASAELKRTADKEPLPTPPVEMDPRQKLSLLLNLLCGFRREAEQEHKVVQTDDRITIVEQWLAALLGDRPSWLSDADLAPGTPLAELCEFYPRFLRSLKTCEATRATDDATLAPLPLGEGGGHHRKAMVVPGEGLLRARSLATSAHDSALLAITQELTTHLPITKKRK